MAEGWFALAGVALAGAIAGVWQAIGHRERVREDRRRERLELVAQFLADVDLIWRAAEALAIAVLEINTRTGQEAGWKRRDAAADLSREPTFRAGVAIARFAILAPELEAPAAALLRDSEQLSLERLQEERAQHRELHDAFVAAARDLLA